MLQNKLHVLVARFTEACKLQQYASISSASFYFIAFSSKSNTSNSISNVRLLVKQVIKSSLKCKQKCKRHFKGHQQIFKKLGKKTPSSQCNGHQVHHLKKNRTVLKQHFRNQEMYCFCIDTAKPGFHKVQSTRLHSNSSQSTGSGPHPHESVQF